MAPPRVAGGRCRAARRRASGAPAPFVHSVDGGLAVGHVDNVDLNARTGSFSLSSSAFIVDVLTGGKQIRIRFLDDRDPLVNHTAYASGSMAVVDAPLQAIWVRFSLEVLIVLAWEPTI